MTTRARRINRKRRTRAWSDDHYLALGLWIGAVAILAGVVCGLAGIGA